MTDEFTAPDNPRYTLDIIRPQHVVPGTLSIRTTDALACEHVGGIIAYGFTDPDALKELLTVLNHFDGNPVPPQDDTEDTWFEVFNCDGDNQDNFAAGIKRNEFDVLCKDGKAIAYMLRDNPASVYVITLINGQHAMTYEKWQQYRESVAN